MDLKQDCWCLTYSPLCSRKSYKLLLGKGISTTVVFSIVELSWCLSFLFTSPQPQYQLDEDDEGYFSWKVISTQIKDPPKGSLKVPTEELVWCNKVIKRREKLSLGHLIYLVVPVAL